MSLLLGPSAVFPALAGQRKPLSASLAESPDRRLHEGSSSKVGQDLAELYSENESLRNDFRARALTEFEPSNKLLRVIGNYVIVDAVASGDLNLLKSDLQALGMQEVSTFGSVVSGWLPIAAIDATDSLESLKFIRPSYARIKTHVVTQGDEAISSDVARSSFGVDGTGITVGVLSDSYDCLGGAARDIGSGDLPEDSIIVDDTAPCQGNIDEGRAMMQLVYDVAPGARLAFHTAFNGVADFAQGIIDLADAGAKVIVDDVVYLAEPMYQDGILAQTVNTVFARGVSYFTSAGNSGSLSYESPFNPSAVIAPFGLPGEAHDFDPGSGVDITQSIIIPEGASFTISFQWDSPFFSVSGPPGAANDIDIYLVNEGLTTLLAAGSDFNIGVDPVEILSYTNPRRSGTNIFNLLILNFQGPNPGLMKYVLFDDGNIDEYNSKGGTVLGHAAAAGAEAVGAAFYYNTPAFGTNPPQLEQFSSTGPAHILFGADGNRLLDPDLRMKPEIVAPDGINTTFFGSQDVENDGFPNFFGTSAAAPHAAAVAALMLEADPDLTPASLYAALEESAIDMDDPDSAGFDAGFDSATGYGFIQADRALQAHIPDAPFHLTFPHIVSDGEWETEVAVINARNDRTLSGTLRLYNDQGEPVSETVSLTLEPHVRREITVGNEFADPAAIGYIVLDVEGQYRAAIPAVAQSNTGDIYVPHIDSSQNWWTGISLVNTTKSSKELTVEFDNGATRVIALAAGGRRSFTIRDLFNGQPQSNLESAVIRDGDGVVGMELFGSTETSTENYLAAVLLKDETTTKIYYPHVASDSQWWTGIVAYNPSEDTPSNLTVTPYTEAGTALASQSLSIDGHGKYIGTVAGLALPNETVWFEIQASEPITGFELFGTRDGNQLAGFTGVGLSNSEGVFAKLEDSGWTGIAFVNIENGPATVSLIAYDDDGEVVATQTLSLAAHDRFVNLAEAIFQNSIAGATHIAYAADREVVGFQLNGSADNMMLDALPGI